MYSLIDTFTYSAAELLSNGLLSVFDTEQVDDDIVEHRLLKMLHSVTQMREKDDIIVHELFNCLLNRLVAF